MKPIAIVISIVILCMQTGCATMFAGTTQEISFTSDPSGASVVIGDKQTTTPGSITLKKGAWQKEAIITLKGYDQTKVTMAGKIEPMYWANLLTLGLTSLVDIITGAYIRYEDKYHVPLNEK